MSANKLYASAPLEPIINVEERLDRKKMILAVLVLLSAI